MNELQTGRSFRRKAQARVAAQNSAHLQNLVRQEQAPRVFGQLDPSCSQGSLPISPKCCGRAHNIGRAKFCGVIKSAFTVLKKKPIPQAFGNRINCAAIPPS
jgi:hypothetical protein